MTKANAIYNFWNSFGITAYEENTVPEDAIFPYITYQYIEDGYFNSAISTVSLWYRDSSWVDINSKTREIGERIGFGGCFLQCDGGKIWVKRGTPFAQNMGDEKDELIKRKYVNITLEFLTAN